MSAATATNGAASTTNGAATEAAFRAITTANRAASRVAVDAAATIAPTVERATSKAKEAGQTWLDRSKAVADLSLDAYDAQLRAYLEYLKAVAAATSLDWAIDLTASSAKIVSDLAATCSSAARDLLKK